MNEQPWFVYLLICGSRGGYYCGISPDVAARVQKHQAGRGSRYTRSQLPVTLTAVSPPLSARSARQHEARIKQLPREQKRQAVLDIPREAPFLETQL